jgi:hypothetical protein
MNMWTVFGVILLVLNAYYVWKDVKNDTIRKGTLLNAFAAGVIMMSILNVMNAQ